MGEEGLLHFVRPPCSIALGESLVGLKLLPWKQERFERLSCCQLVSTDSLATHVNSLPPDLQISSKLTKFNAQPEPYTVVSQFTTGYYSGPHPHRKISGPAPATTVVAMVSGGLLQKPCLQGRGAPQEKNVLNTWRFTWQGFHCSELWWKNQSVPRVSWCVRQEISYCF